MAPKAASISAARSQRFPLRVLPLWRLPALSWWPGQIPAQLVQCRSDGNGEVKIPTFEGYLPTGVRVYVPGFTAPWESPTKGDLPVVRFTGPSNERFEQLRMLFLSCPGERESSLKLKDIEMAVLNEMRGVASTPEEHATAQRIEKIYSEHYWK